MLTPICNLPPGTSLNSFIQTNIQADLSFVTEAGNVIDTVVRILHGPSFPYNVAEVIKTGSLGQGTALKYNLSDIDLVVYLNGMTMEELTNNMTKILRDMERVLRDSGLNYNILCKDEFRLGILLRANGQTFDVDLLPGIPISGSLSQMYTSMCREGNPLVQEHYSVSFAKQQKEFIQRRHTKLKSLFQLMKYWIKVDLIQYSCQKFPSYLMTLIVIHTWEKCGSPSAFNIQVGFKAVLETLKGYQKIQRIWECNYDSSIVRRFMKPRSFHIIDPANPAVDIMLSFDDWPKIAHAAKKTLQSPLLQNVTVSQYWR